MPNRIDISASSMTGLLGAVEASKAAHSLAQKSTSNLTQGDNQEYDLSRYKKGSTLTKKSANQKRLNGSNKGVELRAIKDKDKLDGRSVKLSTVPPSVQEQLAMEALERKSKIYEATILGKKGGLTEKQLESCVLDIDSKRANLILQQDQSLQPPKSFTGRLNSTTQDLSSSMLGEEEQEEEDWIETKDEFGRDLLVPTSKIVPSSVLDPQRTMAFSLTESAGHLQEIKAEYGPQTYFPILECQPEESNKRKRREEEEPIEKYFDAKAEQRQLGTGFYALSSNPEERKRQQEELRARELETNQARATNTTTTNGSNADLSPAQIALEARKRQLLLKKEELARKRSKNMTT